MIMKKEQINEGGVNGTGKGLVNVNSKSFKGLRNAIAEHAKLQSEEDRIKIELLSLRFQMEGYMQGDNYNEIIEIGYYLKEHLKAIKIKSKHFANYLEIEESNLSSIIKGRRKITTDLALKLGQVFQLDPNLWLLIQSKNELKKLELGRKDKYLKYRLEELLRKAG